MNVFLFSNASDSQPRNKSVAMLSQVDYSIVAPRKEIPALTFHYRFSSFEVSVTN